MKILLLLFIGFGCSINGISQEAKIVQLLNQQFLSEQKMYDALDPEKPELIQPFQIKDGILSFEFLYREEEKETQFRREVPLDKIIHLDRDINVIFKTEQEEVKEWIKTMDLGDGNTNENFYASTMFFTEIRKEFGNEKFRNKLLKAFHKAGYKVSNEYWAD